MIKCRVVPIKFQFLVRTVKFEKPHCPEFRVCLRRKNKVTKSKTYKLQPPSTVLNETLQFPTTLEQNSKSLTYDKKDICFDIELRGVTGKSASILLSKSLDLSGMVQPKQLSLQLENQGFEAVVALEVLGQIQESMENCESSIVENTKSRKSGLKVSLANTEVIVEASQNNQKTQLELEVPKSAKSVRKSRGWLTIPEQVAAVQAAPPPQVNQKKDNHQLFPVQLEIKVADNGIHPKPSSKLKSARRFSKSQVNIQPILNRQTTGLKDLDNNSLVDYERQKYRQKKMVRIEQENRMPRRQEDDIPSDDDAVSVFDRSKGNRDSNSIGEYLKLLEENKQLKKELEIAEVKLGELKSSECGGVSLEKSVIQRLKQELSLSSKTNKELEASLSKVNSEKSALEDQIVGLQQKIKNLGLEIERIKRDSISESSVKMKDISPDWKEKYSQLKRQSQNDMSVLKSKLSQLNKERLTKEISFPDTKQDQCCMSKQCDKEKKQLKQAIKKDQKQIEQLEAKIKTKDKLLQNYQSIEEDRGKENLSKDQQDKLRAQKILLQTQLAELKQQLNTQTHPPLMRKTTDTYLRRSEKEAMQKDLEKMRRSYYEMTQEREQQHRNLQEQIKSSKLQVMNVLNAVQEFGGRKLYDQISGALFQ